jgi:hypothetical protein
MNSHFSPLAASCSNLVRLGIGLCVGGFLGLIAQSVHADNAKEAKALFAKPTREYSSAPLWVWNDLLTEDQIRSTMRDLAGQQVRQVFVHPRPGLMTPYLSPDWFRLWKVALDEARRLDMNVWIYDENSYPSGFAGGFVPEQMPESRGCGLSLQETDKAPDWNTNVVSVYRNTDSGFENVTDQARKGSLDAQGRYVVASVIRAGNSPWHGNRCYVDLLYPGVTEKFLEITMGAYKKEIGSEFGKRVPGVFTDEPNIRPAGGLPWTEDLPQQFEKRWGYPLTDHLPSLAQPVGDWRRVRHNYFQLLSELYAARWGKPYHDYCATNNLEFTGHYWDHDWPNCLGVPDNMAMYAWHQRPAIDILMNQYQENTHAQFGNVRILRELSSVANQLGLPRTLCEAYGAGGWDLRFEDMKRIADWLYVLGVNTMDQHLSYVTLRGARKRDHPQSFSYHEPWWPAYHIEGRYIERLTAALTRGRQVNAALVIEPTTTAWMHNTEAGTSRLNEVGQGFFQLLMELEKSQVEYDLGCEEIMKNHGSVQTGGLVVGQRQYNVLVLPAECENLNSATMNLIEKHLAAGGRVLCCGDIPAFVDGAASKRPTQASIQGGWEKVTATSVVSLLQKEQARTGFAIQRAEGDEGILFHHRRLLDDGQLLFLANTSIEKYSSGSVVAAGIGGIEQWDLQTGKPRAYAFTVDSGTARCSFKIPPAGSLLLFLSKKAMTPPPVVGAPVLTTIQPMDAPQILRKEPNVLVIDFMDVRVESDSVTNTYFYRANQFAFKKNGMERNPWDSAVQYKDEFISRKFAPDSGFEAAYHFVIDGKAPANFSVVIEKPDLYRIECNGALITPKKGAWWLDKAFGRIEIAKLAHEGENVITLKAAPFTIYHELEPIYLLGDFSLKPVDKGFVIAPERGLVIAKSNKDPIHENVPNGTMWLSQGIGFGTDVADDRAPSLVFDLGRETDLSAVKIWNYNESNVRDLTARGVSRVRLLALDTKPFSSKARTLGEFDLARASGNTPGQVLKTPVQKVRYVKMEILANHNGVVFPAKDTPSDNGFVGLAEVRFIDAQGEPVKGVAIKQASSELASMDRKAQYLVDGRGLSGVRSGWNAQGHPFYSAGVIYREKFDIKKTHGEYRVFLPEWYGSVAEVRVNGKAAGYIAHAPWECDVTRQLKSGANTVEVTVIGTLKNTLGPHHAGSGLGLAWPGMFQQGPEMGPPAGNKYSTVGYGLFEPFVLRQVAR